MRSRLRCSLLLLALTLLPTSALAQRPVAWGGGDLLVALPVGPFAEVVRGGVGLGLNGSLALFDASPLSLRGDMGFVNYGNETISICVTNPCRVTGDLTTSNNIFFLGVGPELKVGGEGPRVGYLHGALGLAYFSTSSSVRGSQAFGEPFAQSTNQSDLTLAFLAGGGVLVRVGGDALRPTYLDVGVRYHRNGEAEYLRKGDIQDLPGGGVQIRPRRSEADFLALRVGVSFGVGPGVAGAGAGRGRR
jgi:hypothetical protein